MGAVGVPRDASRMGDIASLCRFAKAMCDVPHKHNLQFRVGIHVGPCVAGVIGRNKMAYDIWGDSVNVGSRMESSGEADRVHVSRDVAELLMKEHAREFKLIPRGSRAIKGKGEMETFFVEPASS